MEEHAQKILYNAIKQRSNAVGIALNAIMSELQRLKEIERPKAFLVVHHEAFKQLDELVNDVPLIEEII